MTDAAEKDAINRDAKDQVDLSQAELARNLALAAVRGRKSLEDRAAEIAQMIAKGHVETYFMRRTTVNIISSGNYIDFSAAANFFYPWKDGSNSRPNTSGETLLVQWAGFMLNTTAQALTIQQLQQVADVEVWYGDQDRPVRTIPLAEFLIARQRMFSDGAASPVTQNLPENVGSGFLLDAHEPLVVVPLDTEVYFKIVGIGTGTTAAGSSPALTLTPFYKGIKIRR